MPITVDISRSAEKEIDALDTVIKVEIRARLDKIRADWPNISGLKPMRNVLKNHFHERIAGFRILMKKEEDRFLVVKVEHRSVIYKGKRSSRDVEAPKWVLVPSEFSAEAMRGKPTRSFASEYLMWSIGQDLRAARKAANLTQKELTQKIRRAQSTVSMAEKGQIRVSTAYVKAVLRACKVPMDWGRKYWAAV
jgi:mRNA-degrading endonuclease RelE of RelBE toxin-antitoxin system/DNA-binding XRE family transcriptional regulator